MPIRSLQGGLVFHRLVARAEASNRDTISVTGTGTFNLGSGNATGGGEFVHKDKKGNVLGSGTWQATSVQSYESFGCGGGGFPSNFCGGILALSVSLLAPTGAEFEGVLTIFCAVGPDAPSGTPDAITLDLGFINFDRPIPEASGLTLYVSRSKN